MKYTIDATLMISLEDVDVYLDDATTPDSRDDLDDQLQDALMKVVNDRLVLLDIKGGRTGDDGLLTWAQCESIDNWNKA